MTTELHKLGVGEKEGRQAVVCTRRESESGLKITQFKLEFFKPSKAFSPHSVSGLFYALSFFFCFFFSRSLSLSLSCQPLYGWHLKFYFILFYFLFDSIELHLWWGGWDFCLHFFLCSRWFSLSHDLMKICREH